MTEDNRFVVVPEDFHVWRWRALSAFIVLYAIIGGYSLYQSRARVDDIQQSRIEITRETCEDQNDRNEQTTDLINRIAREDETHGSVTEAAAAERFRTRTLILLNAIIPVRNCEQQIKERFGPG